MWFLSKSQVIFVNKNMLKTQLKYLIFNINTLTIMTEECACFTAYLFSQL